MNARPANREADATPPIPRDALLAVILQNVDGMLVVDRDGVILLANPAAERLLGREEAGLQGTQFGAPLVLDGASDIDVVADGSLRTAEMRVVAVDWHGDPAFLASLRDVTERKAAQAVLARVGAQHEAIAQLGRLAVSGLPPDALMVEAATHVRRVLAADFAGVFTFLPDDDELRLVASDWSALPELVEGVPEPGSHPRFTLGADEPVLMHDARDERRFQPWPAEFASAATIRMQDRAQHFGLIEAACRDPRVFEPDEVTFLQSVANLVAAALARFQTERQMVHQALHDPLTGLPNRALFLDRLAHALTRARRQKRGLAVLFADLDGFKHVNDTLGHHAGDEVLVSIAARLTDALRSSDSLARFGGDEFMMLLEDVDGEQDLLGALERVRQSVKASPFVVEGQRQALDLTIGVVQADPSHQTPEDLIRDADAAMYHAKELGRGGFAIFDSAMREHAADRRRLEVELRAAVDARQFRLFYQPIVSLEDGRTVELEALLRWQHPVRGLLEPRDFLDVAIESRLIVPIGKWTVPEACRQIAAWRAEGIETPTVNVNMAPSELAQPELRSLIAAAIEQGGPGLKLQLEITEGALIDDPSLPATLRELSSSLGVRAALDDFGTGYSSLAYLARFKIDELKIDRSFIRTLLRGHDAPIVTAIVSMAHALGLLVVAEGIETAEQADEARRVGCDRGQGFYFGTPLPPDAIPAFLAR